MGLMDRLRIDGKVAIVTGAGRGVGRGIAVALAEGGATVVCSALVDATLRECDRLDIAINNAGGNDYRPLRHGCALSRDADQEDVAEEGRQH